MSTGARAAARGSAATISGGDDIRGIQKLYGAPGSGGGTGGGGGSFALAAPTNLRAVIVEPTHIRIRWRDVSDSEEEYRVQQHDGDGVFRLIATLPADSFRVDVEGLQPATSYTFRVRARSASGRSAYSEELVVTTAP